MNSILEEICDKTPKMTLVDNSNIRHDDMYDPKHVNDYGFDTFLWNILHTVLGEVPKSWSQSKDYQKKR